MQGIVLWPKWNCLVMQLLVWTCLWSFLGHYRPGCRFFMGIKWLIFFIQSISVAHCSGEACVFLPALLPYSVLEVVGGGSSNVTSSENKVMTEMAAGAGLNRGHQGRRYWALAPVFWAQVEGQDRPRSGRAFQELMQGLCGRGLANAGADWAHLWQGK